MGNFVKALGEGLFYLLAGADALYAGFDTATTVEATGLLALLIYGFAIAMAVGGVFLLGGGALVLVHSPNEFRSPRPLK